MNREAAECVREGERNGINKQAPRDGRLFNAAEPCGGTKTSYGGHGSDEVSRQPGAAFPRGRLRVLDSGQGLGFRGLLRAGRREIGGGFRV